MPEPTGQAQLTELSAVLRSAARAEAEEGEREAYDMARMARSLRDVAVELMGRGDRVAVDLAGHLVTGTIVHAVGDLFAVRDGGSRYDCNLDRVTALAVTQRARTGGRRVSCQQAPSLRARLLELHLQGAPVQVARAGRPQPLVGRVDAVGSDHVVVACLDGDASYVPLSALCLVVTEDAR